VTSEERSVQAAKGAGGAEQDRMTAEAASLRERTKEASARIAALEERLREQERQLAARDAAAPDKPPVTPGERSEEDERRRLRAKVDELKGLVSEGNKERGMLRQELAQRSTAIAKQEPMNVGDATPARDPLERDLPDDAPSIRGVAVPSFAKGAGEALRELPSRVARDALRLVAALAAGDATVWREVKQLERVAPPLLSARVGIHHRVLFRATGGGLDVLEIVHRQGLDATIRRYA
jgi:hypothetical protein